MRLAKLMNAAIVAAALCFSTGAAMADDLEGIKSSGTLKTALSGAFPPFSFVDESNQVVGFDVDISNEVARRLGVEAEIVTTAWDGIVAGLVTGRYDAIIGSLGVTEERAKAVDFVGPYYRTGLGIFVSEGSDVQSAEDLAGKTVGVTLGEAGEQWARAQSGFDIRTYKGLPELLLDLTAGRVDAIVTDDIPVFVAIQKSGLAVVQVEDPNMPQFDVGIAIRKDNPELTAALRKALDDMFADGTYQKISEKWVNRDIR